jgi:cytochrome c6
MAWLKRTLRQRRLPEPATGMQPWAMKQWTVQKWAVQRLLGTALLLLALITAVSPATAADQPAAARARLEAGAQLFEAHCVGCHVNGGNVIRRGRTLKQAALTKAGLADPEAIARIAAVGIGQMSGYGAVLGEQGATQVGEWVWLQARAGWPSPAQMEPLP